MPSLERLWEAIREDNTDRNFRWVGGDVKQGGALASAVHWRVSHATGKAMRMARNAAALCSV